MCRKLVILVCLQVFVVKQTFSIPLGGCGLGGPDLIPGNAVTTAAYSSIPLGSCGLGAPALIPGNAVTTAAYSIPLGGCGLGAPAVIPGNAITTVTALPTLNNKIGCSGPVQSSQMAPLVTEILPCLQLGDITVGGDIPIGGTIKVTGCFPVYGLVSVDGAVPSAGTAAINAAGGLRTSCVI